ncbi:MAG: AfsR/SARP family transcriptional regulator, partial [Acidimicrobiales bacterium]
MVAAGVMWKLWGLRQAQQRRRRRGRDVARTDPVLEPVERRARAVATTEAAEWLDLTLRYLGVALADWPVDSLPAIEVVRAGRFGVEVLIDRVCAAAPSRFVPTDGGRVWHLDPEVELGELKELAGDATPLVPALVSIGTSDDGPLLIDLERAGTLSVEGDAEAVSAFLAGAALELASAPWAADTPVRLLGGDDRLATLEQVDVVDDPEAMAGAAWAGLDLDEAPSTLAGRVGADEALAPVVVIAAPGAASDEVLGRISAKAKAGTAGLVVVAPGPVAGATRRLVIGADRAGVLEPLGIALRCAVDAETVDGLVGLLVGAGSEDDGPPIDLAATVADPAAPGPEERRDAPLVRVLGPVEVPWDVAPQRRVRCEEIAAYLATHHPRRVPRDRLLVAVHPLRNDGRAGEVAASTFRAEISRARVALGRDADGQWYLPMSSREGYVITMASDWARFRELTARAHGRPPAEAIQLLEEALGLVRGRPFEDVPEHSYGWAWSEQLVSTMEVAVAEAAEQLAELALDAEQPA